MAVPILFPSLLDSISGLGVLICAWVCVGVRGCVRARAPCTACVRAGGRACVCVLDMTVTLHSIAQYTESTALPNYGLAQVALGTQLTL